MFKRNKESINPRISKTGSNRMKMCLSKCAVWNSKKSRFIKEQEAIGLLSQLEIRTQLSKIPLLEDIFLNRIWKCHINLCIFLWVCLCVYVYVYMYMQMCECVYVCTVCRVDIFVLLSCI